MWFTAIVGYIMEQSYVSTSTAGEVNGIQQYADGDARLVG